MSRMARYSYLNTLIAILAQSLFSPRQISQLLPQSLQQLSETLQNRGLANVLEPLSQAGNRLLPAGNMDNLFLSVLLNECRSITRAVSGKEQVFFKDWVRRFELQNIKTILRGKSLNHSVEKIRNELTHMDSFSVLPIDELLHCDDINEILALLNKTPYAAIAGYSQLHYEQKQDLFSVEASINWQYYNGLEKKLRLLASNDKNQIQPLFGAFIDQINLTWLLRYRLIYKLSASHTYFLLVPGGRYLKPAQLMALSRVDSLTQIFPILPENLRQQLRCDKSKLQQLTQKQSNQPLEASTKPQPSAEVDNILLIEQCLESHYLQQAYQVLKMQSFSLAKAFAYLLIREKQLFQIHALLKGKLLNLADAQIALAMGEGL